MTGLPPFRNHIGHRKTIKDINRNPQIYVIEDEIIHQQHDNPEKAFYLQKIRWEDTDRIQFRLCYWIIGKKPRMKGEWTYGQSAPMIDEKDLKEIILKAIDKGFFKARKGNYGTKKFQELHHEWVTWLLGEDIEK